MGLVNAVVEPEVLIEHTLKYAKNLARNVSPTSMAVIKRQVYADWDKDLFTAHADSVQLMKESLHATSAAAMNRATPALRHGETISKCIHAFGHSPPSVGRCAIHIM